MTAAITDPSTAAQRQPCTRCAGHGRLRSGVSGIHDGPQCPRCAGRGVEPQRAKRRVGAPFSPAEEQKLLDRLHRVGLLRKEWRDARTKDSYVVRAEIRAEIRDLRREARRGGIPVSRIAEAVGVSRQQLDNIVKDNPSGRS